MSASMRSNGLSWIVRIFGAMVVCTVFFHAGDAFSENVSVVLVKPTFVFENNDLHSAIIDVFSKGKSVELKKDKNNWYRIVSEDDKNCWMFNVEGADPANSDKINTSEQAYKKMDFTVPKTGSTDFRLVKIGSKYSYSLKNANTSEVLKRIGKIEKIDFKVPSELAPVTESGSEVSYNELMNTLSRSGSFKIINDKHILVPYMWSELVDKSIVKKTLFLENVSDFSWYEGDCEGDCGEQPIERPDYLFGLNLFCQPSALSVSNNEIRVSTDNKFRKFDKFQKNSISKDFSEIYSSEMKTVPTGRLQGFVHADVPGAVLTSINYGEGDDGKGSYIFFLDDSFNVKSKYYSKKKILKVIDYSEDGERIFARFGEMDHDSTPEKMDVVFDKKGNVLFEKSSNESEIVLYNTNMDKQIKFDHNKIIIKDIASSSTCGDTTPVEFRKSWLIETGNEYLAVAKNNLLYSIDIKKGKTLSYFKLSEKYNFTAIASGQYAIMSSSDSKGTWSVVDLSNKNICYTSYKGDVFQTFPKRIVKFPSDGRYMLFTPAQRTKSVIFGNNAGDLFKANIFDEAIQIYNIVFKGFNIAEISTDSGRFYIPISVIVQNGKKIN